MRITADLPPTRWARRRAQILDTGLRGWSKPRPQFVKLGTAIEGVTAMSARARVGYNWGSTTEETLDVLKRAINDLQAEADAAFRAIEKETGERKSGDKALRNELGALDQKVVRQTRQQTELAVGMESRAMRWFIVGLGLAMFGVFVGC